MTNCPYLNSKIPAKLEINSNEIIAYAFREHDWVIKPGKVRRTWIDDIDKGHAYNCLPVSIASQYGWIVYSPLSASIRWNGKKEIQDVKVRTHDDSSEKERRAISSHFGSGTFTFTVPFIFRTPPNIQLMVRGVANHVYDNITPLEGVIETAWLSFTFTLNFRINHPNETVEIRKNEPLVMIHPVSIDFIEQFELKEKPLIEQEDLSDEFQKYAKERDDFHEMIKKGTNPTKIQSHYFQGKTINCKKVEEVDSDFKHRNKIKLKGKIE